jgi:hypothetical protein
LSIIIILSGGFGSGKTELALDLALEHSTQSNHTVLADLDLVNPFFASREMEKYLTRQGIQVVAPHGDLSFGDVPSIPPEILGYIRQDNEMIIDLAGDEAGAVVLGYLNRYILERDFEFLLVINPYRPFAASLEEIIKLKTNLEKVARFKFTGIISNPNLVEETDMETIIQGHKQVESYAQKLHLPIRFLAVEERFFEETYSIYGEIVRKIRLFLRPEWIRPVEEVVQYGERDR